MKHRPFDFLHRPKGLKDHENIPHKPEPPVPELKLSDRQNFSEYNAFYPERRIQTLKFLLSYAPDLRSLEHYKDRVQELLQQWEERWSGEYADWQNIADQIEEAENAANEKWAQDHNGSTKTLVGVPTAFSLYIFGGEVITFPEVADLLPQVSEKQKDELATFLSELSKLEHLAANELEMREFSSLLYSRHFAQYGLPLDQAFLIQECLRKDKVKKYAMLDVEDNRDFYQSVYEKGLQEPVKFLQDFPFQSDPRSKVPVWVHYYVGGRLAQAKPSFLQKSLNQFIDEGAPTKETFGRNRDQGDIVGYKLHVRAEYVAENNIYVILPLVSQYCLDHNLAFKVRAYDGQEEQRNYWGKSRFGSTFITIYPEILSGLDDAVDDADLEEYYTRQLDIMLDHARNLEAILAPYPNDQVPVTVTDEDLHLGEDESRRLSIRFGENDKKEVIADIVRRLRWDINDSREAKMEDNFPKALSLEKALRTIREAR